MHVAQLRVVHPPPLEQHHRLLLQGLLTHALRIEHHRLNFHDLGVDVVDLFLQDCATVAQLSYEVSLS